MRNRSRVSMLPIQAESESDADYKFRVFTTAEQWVPQAAESDIPKTGPLRYVWRNLETIRSLTDDELAEEYFTTMNNDDRFSSSWWGVSVRTWLELVKIERTRRYN